MPIGAIVAWPHGISYPTGWVLCDGTANASGSALDLRGRFLVGYDGSHTANGGGLAHTHAAHAAHAFTQPGAHTDHAGVLAHDHGLLRYPTTTGGSSGFTADTSMSGTPTAVTLVTASAGSGSVYAHSAHSGGAVDAHSAHDSPNSEPSYSPIDWIERLT